MKEFCKDGEIRHYLEKRATRPVPIGSAASNASAIEASGKSIRSGISLPVELRFNSACWYMAPPVSQTGVLEPIIGVKYALG